MPRTVSQPPVSPENIAFGSIGTIAGLLIAAIRDGWKNRKHLDVVVPKAQAWRYFGSFDEPTKTWKHCAMTKTDARMYVEFPVLAHNKSGIDDALSAIRLSLGPGSLPCPATSGGLPFMGRNVPAHSLEIIVVTFTFDYGDYGKEAAWTSNVRKYNMTVETIRGATSSQSVEVADVSANEGDVIAPKLSTPGGA